MIFNRKWRKCNRNVFFVWNPYILKNNFLGKTYYFRICHTKSTVFGLRWNLSVLTSSTFPNSHENQRVVIHCWGQTEWNSWGALCNRLGWVMGQATNSLLQKKSDRQVGGRSPPAPSTLEGKVGFRRSLRYKHLWHWSWLTWSMIPAWLFKLCDLTLQVDGWVEGGNLVPYPYLCQVERGSTSSCLYLLSAGITDGVHHT
jgi:hypothetical protein